MPFRAETIRGYLDGLHRHYLTELSRRTSGGEPAFLAAEIESRYRYNQDFKSIFAMSRRRSVVAGSSDSEDWLSLSFDCGLTTFACFMT